MMLVITAVYASCFVLIRAGTSDAPPLAFAALRTGIAGTTLLAVVAATRQPVRPPRRLVPWLVLLAVMAGSAAYGAMFVSPGLAGAGIASVLGNLQPLFVIGLGAATLGERVPKMGGVALGLGSAGAVFIAVPVLSRDNVVDVEGPALALAASIGFAGGSIIVKHVAPGPALLSLTGWQFGIGSLPLFALSAWFERGTQVVWSGRFVTILLFLALIGTAAASVAWYWLVEYEDLGRLSACLYLVPVLGLMLSLVVYGERIAPLEWAGVGLVLLSIPAAILGSWRPLELETPRPAPVVSEQ